MRKPLSGAMTAILLAGCAHSPLALVTRKSAFRGRKHGATPAEVKEVISKSSDDLGDKGFDKYYGFGRINAARALSLLK